MWLFSLIFLTNLPKKGIFAYNTYIAKHNKDHMPYTLITSKGKIMQFYIKATAELYQQINGGVVFTQQVLDTEICPKMADAV